MRLILKILILIFGLLFVYQYVCNCNDNDCERYFGDLTETLDFANTKDKRNSRKNRVAAAATPAVEKPPKKKKITETANKFAKPLIVKDGAKAVFSLTKEDNFTFLKNSESPIDNDKRMREITNVFKNYLDANPQKNIEIVGNYGSDEKNKSDHEDLGKGRAEAVAHSLTVKGIAANRLQTISMLDPTPTYFKDTLLGGIDFKFIKIQELFSIKDGDQTLLETEGQLQFTHSKEQPTIHEGIEKGLGQIYLYLREHPDKEIELVGEYDQSEANPTNAENLGIARAEAMKQKMVISGAPSNQIKTSSLLNPDLKFENNIMSGGLNFKVNTVEPAPVAIDSTKTDTTALAAKDTTVKPFKIGDEEEQYAAVSGKIGFKPSSAEPQITPETQQGLRSVGSYLKKNPTREIDLKGQYEPGETNPTKHGDLGIARAEAVKKEMGKAGSPLDRIKVSSEKVDSLDKEGGVVLKAVQSKFKVNQQTAEQLQSLERKLYFDSDSYNLQLTDSLKQYFRDVKTFLEQNKAASVKLSGHTDNTNTEDYNKELGKNRAEKVKEQLHKMGIDKKNIQTFSEGEKKPLDTNDTEEGKAINRRVEVIIVTKK